MGRTKVALFTAAPIVQLGLETLLKNTEDLELVAAGGNESSFREVLATQRPALVLLDLEAAVEIDTILSLLKEFPSSRFILWTRDASPEFAARVLEAGVRGFLLKTLGNDLLVKCLRKVAEGELWLGKSLTQSIMAQRPIALSPRERQLVAGLNVGLSNKEIAACLDITEGSVKVYLSRLYKKLSVRDRLELVLFSMRHRNMLSQELQQLRVRGAYLGLMVREEDNIGLTTRSRG